MYTVNSDLIYEISTHLDFLELQKLCFTHPRFAQICQQSRFQKLIHDKYDQIVQVIDVATEQLLQNRAIEYTIISGTNKSQKLRFEHNWNDYSITETLIGIPEQESILPELFPSTKVIDEPINSLLLMIHEGSIKRLGVKDLTLKEIQRVLYYLVTHNLLNLSSIKITTKGLYGAIFV
ncbi:MAG: hypothetical protein H0U27_09860 [Nitrosopumilus sp.]|nr:hypothetical protein [Nitrosopumilus sp.]